MTSVSAGHIKLTPTQPAGSGRPQRESNPGPPHQESRALPTEPPRPPNVTGRDHSQNASILLIFFVVVVVIETMKFSCGRNKDLVIVKILAIVSHILFLLNCEIHELKCHLFMFLL